MHKSNRKKIEEKGIQRKKEGKREQEVSLPERRSIKKTEGRGKVIAKKYYIEG